MSYSIVPQGDRLLLRADPTVERVVGGLVIPVAATESQDELRRCTVVAMGTACKESWTKDMRVLVAKDGGTPVKINKDEQYIIIGEGDILAEITDEDVV